MVTTRIQTRRAATVATATLAITLFAGCSDGGAENRAAQPVMSTSGSNIALAEDIPASLAFVDQSVAPSTGTVAVDGRAVGVHSAPDRFFTRLGELSAGDMVGLTGNRAGVDGEQWAEIIWESATAWIPTTALAP